jgi:hypothetical protein
VAAAAKERSEVERAIFALTALVTRTEPGDVTRSRAEALRREAEALLMAGGEAPPRLSDVARERLAEQSAQASPA